MPTIRLVVRYDGTDYSGWQRQRGVPTVQETLEAAIASMASEPVTVRGAGRTDAGVHALAQVASFTVSRVIPVQGWLHGLNGKLPPSIAVTDARVAQDDFDPRRASGGKRYRYLLHAHPVRDPFLCDRAWHVHHPLDLDALETEARALVGTHDFRAFRAADCERKTTVRTLFRVAVSRSWAGRPNLVAIEVEGTAFLKNMVRVLVGTLVDVARERLPPGTVDARLRDGDRTQSGITAPPQGLYLDEVFLRPQYLLPEDVLRAAPELPDAQTDLDDEP
ncbi:MAG: tRNA pseudouridine(38-40) synthase TruA [Deltaproteobacteria bacterium]|nr:tRNA pseudouridine(38-40) synthase TruA [Deltaproteobacteria bacterium]